MKTFRRFAVEHILKRIIKYIPRKIKRLLIGNILCRIQTLETVVGQTIKNAAGIDFQGQVGQDLFAYLYFNGKKEGFYVDIGANDGITSNNTIIFENLGWNGICIEPLPDVFKQLQKNRRCDCFNVAVSNENGSAVEFIRAAGVEMLSGLGSQMTDMHKKRIKSNKGDIERIYVKALTFDDLMSGYSERRYVDFMSIDVEGAEMSILKTIDFNKYKFGLITVENNEETRGNGEQLEKYMKEQGYKVYLDLGLDIMFIQEIK
jgi:FkbM family methyltransferase